MKALSLYMIREAEIPSTRAACDSVKRPLLNVGGKVVLGTALPLMLLHFDPFVLGGRDGDSLVGSLSASVYVLMFLAIAAFLVQSVSGRRGTVSSAILAGAIFAGALVSGLLGMAMLPVSVLALRLYGLGLLGLFPFVVSVLYFRTAQSAFSEDSANQAPRRSTFWWALGGFVTVIAIPALLLFAANAELDRLTAAGRAGNDLNGVDWRSERYRTWAGDSDRIVGEYRQELRLHRNSDLDVLYWNLTGREIQVRLQELAHPD